MLTMLESLTPRMWARYEQMRSSPDYWRPRQSVSPKVVEQERVCILRLLNCRGGMTAAEIAISRNKSIDAVRGHLKVLALGGLVQSRPAHGSGRLLQWSISPQGKQMLAKEAK